MSSPWLIRILEGTCRTLPVTPLVVLKSLLTAINPNVWGQVPCFTSYATCRLQNQNSDSLKKALTRWPQIGLYKILRVFSPRLTRTVEDKCRTLPVTWWDFRWTHCRRHHERERGWRRVSLYKILFHFKALLWESIIRLPPPPTCKAYPIALQLHDHCAINGSSLTLL